jgi:hypothetical protein
MGWKCCIPACRSGYAKDDHLNISFHKFPVDSDLRSLWLRNIPRKDWKVTKYSRVCSVHFDLSCFLTLHQDSNTTRHKHKVEEISLKKRVLISGAVPTLFPGYPCYLSTSIYSKRSINTQGRTGKGGRGRFPPRALH